jgi:flagellar biogenesis protein FliO
MDNFLLELFFMLLALIFVVTIAWFILKGFKRFHIAQGDGNRLALSLTLPVGTRERVVVLSYRESEYLVGITPGGMHLLDKLPKSEEAKPLAPDT